MARKLGLALALAAAALATLAAGSAQADPVLDVKARWGNTTLKPGENGLYVVRVRNHGSDPTSGPVTVSWALPPGVTRIPPTEFDAMFGLNEGYGWTCEGTTSVTCTTSEPIKAFDAGMPWSVAWFEGTGRRGAPGYAAQIYVRVAVDPSAGGEYTNVVTVSGGGAAAATDEDPLRIAAEETEFGFTPGNSEAEVYDAEYPAGQPVRQAGSHPFEMRVNFDFNLEAGAAPSPFPPLVSDMAWTDVVRRPATVKAILPKGLIGNPEATPKCSPEQFLRAGSAQYTSAACPPETQVGTITLMLSDFFNNRSGRGDGGGEIGGGEFSPASWTRIPVYNLEPPRGYAADFAFNAGDYRGHIYPTLDPTRGYRIEALTPYISSILPVRSAEFTMWGVPADPAHDHLRSIPKEQGGTPEVSYGAPSKAPIRPFLTLPTSCGGQEEMILEAESYARQGHWVATDLENEPLTVNGCDDGRLRFKPEVQLQPTSRVAGGPTGLRVELKSPQRDDTVVDAAELYEQNGDIQSIATPTVKKAVVTLPEGMTISTSAAQGLGACSLEQIGLGTNRPVSCPDSSKYGSLTLHTPILPKDAPMTGQIYIAEQDRNPFNSFLALYLVVEDPQRGLLVKLPGRVDLDPVTGQITTTFDDLPEFPVSNMELTLKGGMRAALVNPATCGTKTISATFYSWSRPNTPVSGTSTYEIGARADGSPCVNNLAERPFRPRLDAGTVNPLAGAYSPFVFRTQRSDDDQEFSRLDVKLPKGLLANISGLAKCPDAAIAAAAGRTGTDEANSPSCPASSQIGSTDVGSGVGEVLTYVPGKAYLAGPYKGAPLSIVVITPILAGPYDLGVIAVRSKAEVDPHTAEVTVTTDPFPLIFKGIPVRIRDIRVKVDRQNTMINPTSCGAMSIGGQIGSAEGALAPVSAHFQTANCADLAFKPKLTMRLKGKMKRAGNPALRAVLTAPPGQANIERVQVVLPKTAFIDNAHINNPCTREQYAAKACPPKSILGKASAYTPLLDQPLSGNVYFRSNGGERDLPDLVVALRGEFAVDLVGHIDAVENKKAGTSRVRTTFAAVPDAPVSKFVMDLKGGKVGLIENSANLCRVKNNRATVRMNGQNGSTHQTRPQVRTSCKKKKTTTKK